MVRRAERFTLPQQLEHNASFLFSQLTERERDEVARMLEQIVGPYQSSEATDLQIELKGKTIDQALEYLKPISESGKLDEASQADRVIAELNELERHKASHLPFDITLDRLQQILNPKEV